MKISRNLSKLHELSADYKIYLTASQAVYVLFFFFLYKREFFFFSSFWFEISGSACSVRIKYLFTLQSFSVYSASKALQVQQCIRSGNYSTADYEVYSKVPNSINGSCYVNISFHEPSLEWNWRDPGNGEKRERYTYFSY